MRYKKEVNYLDEKQLEVMKMVVNGEKLETKPYSEKITMDLYTIKIRK